MKRYICNEVVHHNLNAWYLVIYLLITVHISDSHQFSDIYISRGSVATYLRCVGMFTHTVRLFQIYHWVCQRKKENRLIFVEVMGESLVSCLFLTHGVELVLQTFFQLLDRLQNYRIFNVRTII